MADSVKNPQANTIRTFVAARPSARVVEGLAAAMPALQAGAEADGVRVTWTRPEGWHITLAFLGDIATDRQAPVEAALAQAAAGASALEFHASDLAFFPTARRARAVVAVVEDDGSLEALSGAVWAALAPLGLEPERRSFRAHLTLGRIRSPLPRRGGALREAIAAASNAGGCRADTMEFFRSELGEGGSRYQVLASLPLGSGDSGSKPADLATAKSADFELGEAGS